MTQHLKSQPLRELDAVDAALELTKVFERLARRADALADDYDRDKKKARAGTQALQGAMNQ